MLLLRLDPAAYQLSSETYLLAIVSFPVSFLYLIGNLCSSTRHSIDISDVLLIKNMQSPIVHSKRYNYFAKYLTT